MVGPDRYIRRASVLSPASESSYESSVDREDAAERGLDNLDALVMAPNAIDLPGNSADFIVMGQLHHELDAPEPLLTECKRLLKSDGIIATPKTAKALRLVAASLCRVCEQNWKMPGSAASKHMTSTNITLS